MLDWNDLHPYNAVHVAGISLPPSLTKLKQAIEETLAFQGVTNLTLNRKRGTFRFAGGAVDCELETIAPVENPRESLRAAIERQINTRFEITRAFLPFRFFVVAEKESFHLGLVYFHAVADAVSIVLLLRQICAAYLGGKKIPDAKPFSLARQKFRLHPFSLVRKLADFVALQRQHRHSTRVSYANQLDGRNRYEHLSLPPDKLRGLAAAAKTWEVTINDIFLATLLLCCSPFTLSRRRDPGRGRLTVGCIVNTRNDLGLENPQAWGLFLGSFVVSHETPEGIRLPDLARDIRRQTLILKRRKNHVGASPELVVGRFLLSFFSTEYRTKLYQKHYPLWGGVTNMNLNLLWPQAVGEPAVDCLRGVSTGPVTPLVLSVTTIRDVVNLGLTFRAATFTEQHIQQVKINLPKILEQLNSRA